MKKYILSGLAVLLAFTAGCQKAEPEEPVSSAPGCDVFVTCADMSGYAEFDNTDGIFYETTPEDLYKAAIEEKQTIVAFFGFAQCPWCNDALPVLNGVAKENNLKIAYINTRNNDTAKSNIEMDGYDTVLKLIGDTLEEDDVGIPHLYVPYVCVFKDGKEEGFHTGTLDSYDPAEREMTDEETAELRSIYTDLLAKAK